MKFNKTSLTLAIAGLFSLPSAFAQSSQDLREMREEIRALRAEVQAARRAGAGGGVSEDRLEAVEMKQKDSVVGGDIPGSFRLPDFPGQPKNDTSVRVYGYVEGNLVKDFKGTNAGDNFTNMAEQPVGDANTNGKTVMTGQTSRLGFETSTPTSYGSLVTKIEADFYGYQSDGTSGSTGNRNRLRLRHAYGEYAGWMIGQNWSTFMDIDNLPETVDFNGPPGATFRRPVQLRYTFNNPNLAKFQVALEDGTEGARSPNVVLRVDKTFDWGLLGIRFLTHEAKSGTTYARGNGMALSGVYKLTGTASFLAQYTKIDGDTDGAYLIGSNFPTKVGNELVLDRAHGLVLGLTNVFSPKFRATASVGTTRSLWGDDSDYVIAAKADTNNLANLSVIQYHLGGYYSPVRNVELGAELIGGKRVKYDRSEGDMSRVNLQARFLFN